MDMLPTKLSSVTLPWNAEAHQRATFLCIFAIRDSSELPDILCKKSWRWRNEPATVQSRAIKGHLLMPVLANVYMNPNAGCDFTFTTHIKALIMVVIFHVVWVMIWFVSACQKVGPEVRPMYFAHCSIRLPQCLPTHWWESKVNKQGESKEKDTKKRKHETRCQE